MTKEEVAWFYEIWKNTPGRRCDCKDHFPENKDICLRERAWREYCFARDQYVGKRKEGLKPVDLGDLFASIADLD